MAATSVADTGTTRLWRHSNGREDWRSAARLTDAGGRGAAFLAGPHEPRLVAEPAVARDPSPAGRERRSLRRRFRLSRSLPETRLRSAEARPHRADDRQPAVVARRLRTLWSLFHPHGLARRWHVSHRR